MVGRVKPEESGLWCRRYFVLGAAVGWFRVWVLGGLEGVSPVCEWRMKKTPAMMKTKKCSKMNYLVDLERSGWCCSSTSISLDVASGAVGWGWGEELGG